MQKVDQYKKLHLASAALFLCAVQTGLFAFVWFGFYAEGGASIFVRGNVVLLGLYGLTLLFFHHLFGGLNLLGARGFELLFAQLMSILGTNIVTYLQLCLICRWQLMTNIVPMLLLTGLECGAELLWSLSFRRIFHRRYPPERILLIYGDYNPDGLIRKLQTSYRIQAALSCNTDFGVIREKIQEVGTVILTDIPAQIRNDILKFCFDRDIRCYCVPKLSDVMLRSAQTVHLKDTTLLLFRNMGLSPEQKLLKRIMDVLAAVILGTLTAPVMVLISICIKLCDGGPVLFSQERLTENGKVFRVYKFRSMRVSSASGDYTLTRKNDQRITPVGKLIRNIHLDELPQLYNILRGDMSFVGPRPECPELAEEYRRLIPQFPYRLKVKAGLTGYAQVYGKYNSTPYDKLKLDLHYIENYSPFLDVKLMLLTVRILFQKEHTEGIEPWQKSAVQDSDPRETVL